MTISTLAKIRLDWDNIGYSEALRRIEIIKRHKNVIYVDLFASSSRDGYHTYVSIDTKDTIDSMMYRRIWKDDGKRMVTDILKAEQAPHDVLFYFKTVNGNKNYIEFMKRF